MKASRFSAGLLPLVALTSPAFAQTAAPADEPAAEQQQGLADIVVTAQRRKENSQEVPIALTALSGEDIVEQRVQNLADLNSIAPALRITNADAAANPKIFIRGIGLNDFNPTSSSGVGMYVDGVYVGSLLAQLASFYDLQQVEVLRGPQGTLFGRNTTGGAINITTRQPTFDQSMDIGLEYGNFHSVTANAAAGGTLISDLAAFRIAGMLNRDDGHTVNRYDGSRVNNNERYAVRASVLIEPSPDTQFTISGNRFWNRGGARQPKSRGLFPTTEAATGSDSVCASAYFYSSQCTDAIGYAEDNDNPYSINSNIDGTDRIDLWGVSGTLNQKLGALDLVSITAYSKVKRDDLENTDTNPYQMLEINYVSAQSQFTQELRLQGEGGRLNWVLGGYYMHEVVTNDTATDLLRLLRPYFITDDNPTGAAPAYSVAIYTNPLRQVTDSYAVFGQTDYKLTPSFVATLGLRYSADRKDFHYTRYVEGVEQFTFDDTKTFGDWSGRLGLRYEIEPDWNVYASYNRGYKSGGYFGGSASSVEELQPYRNETVNAFEVGSKATTLGNSLRLNLSAFYYDYQDIQAFSLVLRDGVTVQVLDNAASAKMYGGEAEMTFLPVDNLEIGASAAYLHANYGEYISLSDDDYTGNRMPHSPKWSFTGKIKYEIPLGDDMTLTPRLDASYRTKVYFDSTQRERLTDSPAFLLNGEIAFAPSDQISFGVWGKNLTDHTYLVGISAIDSLGVDLMSYAAPRTYGAFLRYSY